MKNIRLRAFAVWAVIMSAETVHGILRTFFLEPRIGAFRARQLSVFTACAIMFVIARVASRWLGAVEPRQLLNIGALWAGLTVAFELGLGRALGLGWDRILADYNMAEGGLMPLGLLFLCFAPWLAARNFEYTEVSR